MLPGGLAARKACEAPGWMLEQNRQLEAEIEEKYRKMARKGSMTFNPPTSQVQKSIRHAESLGLSQNEILRRARQEEEARGGFEYESECGSDREGATSATRNFAHDPEENSEFPILKMPKWYDDIKKTNFSLKQASSKRGPSWMALDSLKDCVRECEKPQKPTQLKKLHEKLRDHIHKAEIALELNKFIIKGTLIFNADSGLPRIFKRESTYPTDLKADAYHLYRRWINEDFSQDILRGIITVKGKDRNGDHIDQTYRKNHPASAKFYGEGNLVLGQWWPTQLCTVRDGAHGSSQGGISGDKENGAYSIVLSSGGYDDKDEGDLIEYCGTDGKNFKPTDATLAMIKSAQQEHLLRVIRSSQLRKSNKYRPQYGFRYDGLYQIKSYVVIHEEKQIHRFQLQRCSGQQPIRCKGSESERPTIYEKRKFEELKKKDW